MYLFYIFKSHYCKIVFLIMLLLSYFIIPKNVFYGWYYFLAIPFIIGFSLVTTCLIRGIKEKVLLAKTYKESIIGIIATAIGWTALQVCGIGAPVCGISLGFGLLAFLPLGIVHYLHQLSVYIVIASILTQFFALYKMSCFKKFVLKQKNNVCHN